MAFVTVEDLYGPTEVIVFESCYQNCSNILMEDNIVLVDGRLSIREDEDIKIVARDIKEFGEQKKKVLVLDITNTDDEQKEKLRGAIRFFSGEKNNITSRNNKWRKKGYGRRNIPKQYKQYWRK